MIYHNHTSNINNTIEPIAPPLAILITVSVSALGVTDNQQDWCGTHMDCIDWIDNHGCEQDNVLSQQ